MMYLEQSRTGHAVPFAGNSARSGMDEWEMPAAT